MSRQHFPRQSAPSSGSSGVATSSASDATTSSGVLDLPTSGFASATDTTSGLSPPSTSGAVVTFPLSPSESAGLTTTSPGTTSTSQSAPSSQSGSSSVPSTSSLTSTSSSSVPLSATSSTTSPSSSVPPSTTTQPPTPSSSQQGTPTTITSSYTTYINGSAVVTQTSYPSTIPAQSGPSSSSRAAIIGGSAAGGTAVLIILLSLAFCARRKRFKRLNFLDAITLKRKQIHSRATLLDGEDLVDVGLQCPPHRYTDYETPWDARDNRDGSDRALMAGIGTPSMPRTLTGPSRWSETGSAFREDTWPPPHEGTRLMDPLANRDNLDLDLTRIVDDVMGPSLTAAHFSDRSVSSMYRDSVAGSEGVVHSRTVSNASNAALLDAAGLGGTTGAGTLPTAAPARPSPLAQSETKPGSVEQPGGNAS